MKMRSKIKQEIKEVQEDPLYSAMTYEIKTQTQQENELLKLDKEKKRIKIIVSDQLTKEEENYTAKLTDLEEKRRKYAELQKNMNNLIKEGEKSSEL